MHLILRVTADILLWLWGLHILIFTVPNPVAWHYAALFCTALLIRMLLGPRRMRDIMLGNILGFGGLVYLVLWGIAWYHGWPADLTRVVIWTNVILGPLGILHYVLTTERV